jgi:hypothetical protein
MANGGEGFIGKHFVRLWRIEELANRNQDYQVAEYAPEFDRLKRRRSIRV